MAHGPSARRGDTAGPLAIRVASHDKGLMIVIGLIGRIGSGKSTVARRFAEHGAHVIDADRIAHEVLGEDDVVRRIADRFGADVVDATGRIRRGVVADHVFGPSPAHAAALEWLEGVVHPRVRRRIAAELEAIQARDSEHGGRTVVVLDVPLLVQSGWFERCDHIVMVACAEDVRRRRLEARGWSPSHLEARDAAWNRKSTAVAMPAGKMATVDTSRGLAYTHRQVDGIWTRLSG